MMRKPIWMTLVVLMVAAGVLAPGGGEKKASKRHRRKVDKAAQEDRRQKCIDRLQKRLAQDKKRADHYAERLKRARSEEARTSLAELKELQLALVANTTAMVAATREAGKVRSSKLHTERTRLWRKIRQADRLLKLSDEMLRARKDVTSLGDNPELAALAQELLRVHAKLAENYKAETKLMQDRDALHAQRQNAGKALQAKAKELMRAKRKADRPKKKRRGKKGRERHREKRRKAEEKKPAKGAENVW